MNISKKASLILFGITALALSRTLLALFDDPEGPNLLVVTVLAIIVYLLSLTVFLFNPFKDSGLKRFLLVILIQIVIVTGLYFYLN